jgi:hypothetical protein
MKRNDLHWVKSERVGDPWHLTFNGRDVLCGMQHWGGPPLRPHGMELKSGPPSNPCIGCRDAIATQLDLHPPEATTGVLR